MPLVPTQAGMNDVFLKAMEASREEDPFELVTFDYRTKAATLYKLLVPKPNFDLFTDIATQLQTTGVSFVDFSTASSTHQERTLSST